ncbi:MAG: membrane protein insertase YidC [Kiritimatiellae bacterium]|nr:membrane protein insertase YidC [Kiritimatiellia bacterium]
MNKSEKIISLILGLVLVWYLFSSKNEQPAEEAAEVETAQEVAKAPAAPSVQNTAPQQSPSASVAPDYIPSVPAEYRTLENEELKLTLSSHGGVVTKAVLKKYNRNIGEAGENNPPVEFDFSASPLGAISSPGAIAANEVFEIVSASENEVVFKNEKAVRKISLRDNYNLVFEDTMPTLAGKEAKFSLGSMRKGEALGDLPSIDSWSMEKAGGKVIHHNDDDSPLKPYLSVSSGGCSCASAKNAQGYDIVSREQVRGAQKWVALKNQFFVTALVETSADNSGFSAEIRREDKAEYVPEEVTAKANITIPENGAISSTFFLGPKKQALLWDLGMKDVMDFGMWRWVCYPIVWVLNICHKIIPNYGIAIILLTILVRVLFWPLTHKSTVGMKKMQEIQPLMKEVQTKFKDNPQRMQQEIFALYREHKVNPLSSCLPMLVQIPVFIALFNVLRSAVELRYASFLWISDLSQPEHLFASWFPWFGGLNILPILMALTMGLQSALTPSTGDDRQKKMMVIFMPVMMLVMFYNFASALSLYWTLSQLISILQMWLIKRNSAKGGAAAMPEVIEPVVTRQMRRHN